MNRFSFRNALLLLLVLSTLVAGPALADDKTDKVDKVFTAWDSTTSPGAALAVVQDGAIIYERGYGMAKLEDGLVMTPDKVFDIGSVSKQFTAACLAFLVRDGKVAPGDDIRKYIPEFPQYEKVVTVEHLLHHTSGIRDYNALLELSGFRDDSDCPTNDEALDVICRQKKLNYLPGEEYSYTNSGYFLIGLIVERVSGQSLNQFAQERIFKPLGMSHTLFQQDHTQIIKDRASGYSPEGKSFRLNMSNWDEVGDGNVYTTVEDLSFWDQAFTNGKLGPGITDMLQTVGTLNNGTKQDYAWGLVIGEYKGLKTVSHSGAWAGFRAAILRFPEQKFSVICLANLASMNPTGLCRRVADIYLAPLLKDTPKETTVLPNPVTLTPQELAALAGNYQDSKFGLWMSLSVKDNGLRLGEVANDLPAVPVSATRFQATVAGTPLVLEFAPVEKGQPRRAKLTYGTEEAYEFTQATSLKPLTPAQLDEFAGDYNSPELLGATYQLVVDKGSLIVKFRSASQSPMKAMAPDKFTLEGVNLDFVRNRGGKITGATLSTGRAAGIVFHKLKGQIPIE